jgi:ABC-type nitrate/sulfonate/bicarbonate transport system substrate-binding protein
VERIRIGVAHSGAGVAPLFAAVEGGYLRDQGLEPELIACPGHARSLAALIAGEVDFINSVGPELILANLRHGGDALVIASAIGRSAQQVAARPGLKSREDLRGRRWGVVARNDADECAIVMAFELWNWDPVRDATLVVVGSQRSRLDALLDPACVDAAILHAPEPFQAAKRGWHLVEDLSRLDVALQNSCAAATRRSIARRPDTVLRYVRAYCQAVHRFRTDAAFGTALLGKYTRERDPAVIEATWVLFARLMGGMMFPSLEGMRTALAVLNRLGAAPATAMAHDFVDLEFVASLEREGFFARLLGVPVPPDGKASRLESDGQGGAS